MVRLTYKGQNTVTFPEFIIRGGDNEIADKVFYKLMQHPLFAARIKAGTFVVPSYFPLDEPRKLVKIVETE